MKTKKHFLNHKDAKITHWRDDFDVYRWNIALTTKFLVALPKDQYEKLLDGLKNVAEVLEDVTKRDTRKDI